MDKPDGRHGGVCGEQYPTSARSWRLSHHARRRAAELGYDPDEILRAAEDPDVAYEQTRFPGQQLRQRGDVAVAVDPRDQVVITVLLRRRDRWAHGRDGRAVSA